MYDLIYGTTTEPECTATEVREVVEEGDCLADVLEVGTFTDGLESCSYTLVFDECQMAEISCDVSFVEYGEVIEMTCAELEEYFFMNEVTECVEEFWDDCMYLDVYIPGITECDVYATYDWCQDIDLTCDVVATINGTLVEDTCDNFEAQHNLPDENCVEFNEYDCMDMVPETIAADVLECWIEEAYDSCMNADLYCFVSVDYAGEYITDTCDNIATMFGVDPEDPTDCAGSEEGECMTMFTEYHAAGLEECYYWYTWDMCETSNYEECWAQVTINGTAHEGDCAEIEAHFGNSTHNNTNNNTNCLDWGEPMSCMSDFEGVVDGLESCQFWEVEDCNGELHCKVRGQVHGEMIEGPCDDVMDMFFGGNGTFNGTEECTIDQVGPTDCMDLFEGEALLESCDYWVEYDTCTFEEISCYVEVNYDRQLFEGECDAVMEEIFGLEPPGCEDEWDGPYMCFDDYSSQVPGLESCEYWDVTSCIG